MFGLKSLRNLFPNLTVIRGERLKSHYALIIYELTDLTEVQSQHSITITYYPYHIHTNRSVLIFGQIGLVSLIKIQRGYVMIRYCPMLCYVHTVSSYFENLF